MSKVELGDIAKDEVSGFQGVVVAVTNWLNGCNRIYHSASRAEGWQAD